LGFVAWYQNNYWHKSIPGPQNPIKQIGVTTIFLGECIYTLSDGEKKKNIPNKEEPKLIINKEEPKLIIKMQHSEIQQAYKTATEMGFTLNEKGTRSLIYNGETVATDIMKGWMTDGDWNGYEDGDCKVYVRDSKVGVIGELVQVGGDRPGISYRGYEAFFIGTLDGDKFVKNETEERDLEMKH